MRWGVFGWAMLPWFKEGRFPVFLAPMDGYTDPVFRGLCKLHGADVLVTELISAEAVNHDVSLVERAVGNVAAQRPLGVQLIGSEPEVMARAACRVVEVWDPDFVDLNFGCPSLPTVANGSGASLLRDTPRLLEVAAYVVRAIPGTVVTAKLRLGWDEGSKVFPALAGELEAIGVQALTIHGRTKVMGYSGRADWQAIREVAGSVKIPVVGNGDLREAAQVVSLRDEGLVAGVMVGRAALGYPWLFREMRTALAGLSAVSPPTVEERWDTILAYARGLADLHGIDPVTDSIAWMRARLSKMLKHMAGSVGLRTRIGRVERLIELEAFAACRGRIPGE